MFKVCHLFCTTLIEGAALSKHICELESVILGIKILGKSFHDAFKLQVKYAGVAQHAGLKHHLIKPKDEPIVLSVPESVAPQNIQPASSQKTPSASALPLPEPVLPIVVEKDSQNGTIPSLPSDSHQQLGITTIPAIPQNSNRNISPVLSKPSSQQGTWYS